MPVDVWKLGSEEAWLEFLQPFEDLAYSQELHTDHIKQILPFVAVEQIRSGQQRLGFPLDPLERLPKRREQQKKIASHALMPS